MIKNESGKDIYYRYTFDKVKMKYLILNNPKDFTVTFLKANDSNYIVSMGSWESTISSSNDEKLYFYIFSHDSFSKYREKKLYGDSLIYKKYEFTTEQLDKIKWKIVIKDSL